MIRAGCSPCRICRPRCPSADPALRPIQACAHTWIGCAPSFSAHPAVRLLDALRERGAERVHILLDEPVSNSGRLKTLIAAAGEGYPFALDIRIRRDVDRELYGKENVVTSDSIILDHCKSWVNLAARCAEKHGVQPMQVWE